MTVKRNVDRFSRAAESVLTNGYDEANRLKHEYFGTEDILLGMTSRLRCGLVCQILRDGLRRRGLTMAALRRAVERAVGEGTAVRASTNLPWTRNASTVLQCAKIEAANLNDSCIEPKHLLLAFLRLSHCLAAEVLAKHGFHYRSVRQKIIELSTQQRKKKRPRRTVRS